MFSLATRLPSSSHFSSNRSDFGKPQAIPCDHRCPYCSGAWVTVDSAMSSTTNLIEAKSPLSPSPFFFLLRDSQFSTHLFSFDDDLLNRVLSFKVLCNRIMGQGVITFLF